MKRFAILCTLLAVLALLTLGTRCGGETPVENPTLPSTPATIDLKGTSPGTPAGAYDLCIRDEQPSERTAGVQVFLDASGSMRGFSVPGVMSPLAQWVKR